VQRRGLNELSDGIALEGTLDPNLSDQRKRDVVGLDRSGSKSNQVIAELDLARSIREVGLRLQWRATTLAAAPED